MMNMKCAPSKNAFNKDSSFFMGFFVISRLFSCHFSSLMPGHVIASTVASNLYGCPAEVNCCVFQKYSLSFNVFFFLFVLFSCCSFVSVYVSVVIDILFMLYFQGAVGPPGPPGPVSTIQGWKLTLEKTCHFLRVKVLLMELWMRILKSHWFNYFKKCLTINVKLVWTSKLFTSYLERCEQ